MIFILVNIVMSGYLWRIRITGNMYYSSKEIIDYINSMDIHYGMKTGRIACDDIEAGLRQNFERITWVSADVNGSRLRINIKEEMAEEQMIMIHPNLIYVPPKMDVLYQL